MSLLSLMTLSQVPLNSTLVSQHDLACTYWTVYTGQSRYPAGPSETLDSIDSFAAVTAYLRSRLLDTFSAAAASMAMRPSLHEAYTNLLSLLSNTAETPGANHSFLLLGARGTGKSLVWTHSLSQLVLQHAHHKQPEACALVEGIFAVVNQTAPVCPILHAT